MESCWCLLKIGLFFHAVWTVISFIINIDRLDQKEITKFEFATWLFPIPLVILLPFVNMISNTIKSKKEAEKAIIDDLQIEINKRD